ncbi:hypothetical protein R50072_36530 [Simiduia litorea]|uniref:RDD family protein n=1 Tax=Simiduia litorea TaxID=1435348 RepID=UPI0036F3B822
MESEIDFSRYSLSDLYSSAESIDREKYPERAKTIDALIIEKERENPEEQRKKIEVGDKASRIDRLWAALIDGLIQYIAALPLIYYVGFDALKAPTPMVSVFGFAYGFVVIMLLHGQLLYHSGQTVGKYFMSIRIENLNGTKANFKKIVLLRILPMALIMQIPGFGSFIAAFINPLMIFGKERRCLHDHIAGTNVCYTNT